MTASADLLIYVKNGWPVFPCHGIADGRCTCGDTSCASPGKHPRVSAWQQAATTDINVIEGWLARFPGSNWGMPTGINVDVLDEDPRHDGDKTLAQFEAANGPLPTTVRVLTQSDGTHRLFKTDPEHPVRNGTNVLGPGVDVRGIGGFVVIPPSIGVTGRAYRFDLAAHPDDVPVASWTAPLLKRVNGGTPTSAKVRLDVPAVLAGVPDGARDNSIWALACKLRRSDVPQAAAVDVVLKAAASALPPYPADRAEEKVHRAYRTYPPGPEIAEPESVVTIGTKPQNEPVAPRALDDVVGVARRWRYLPDPRGLYAALGAYAANAQEGDPVWLLVVGASGTGKTEAVATLAGLDGVHAVSTLTEASLLSGTAKKDKAKTAKGGLLREIGDRGVLLVKDFTSILSMHRDARAGVLAALREIYDGSYTRHVGTDGGRTLAWSGRIGLIGCTTPVIDLHHAVMASMGERFLLYRMPEVDRHALTRSALGHARNGSRMRQEIADAVRGLLANINTEAEPVPISSERTEHLIALANYTAIARSAVERDGRSREIELVVGAEAPTRLAIGLSRLLGGMQAIGVDDLTAWRTTVKVALDCIPAIRRKVLDTLAAQPNANTSEVAESVAYPTTTARRTLEDMHAYGLVDRDIFGAGKADRWTLSDLAAGLRGTVPEMSVDVRTADVESPSI